MAGHEEKFNGVSIKGNQTIEEVVSAIKKVIPEGITNDDIYFLCIGTDTMTGDSFAPLVGMYLTEAGYSNVIGTVDNPCHAVNLKQKASEIPEGKIVIAIDACLGKLHNIGNIDIIKGSIKPGAGVNKNLGTHGDYGICGVVNFSSDGLEYFTLMHTRLSTVMNMAKTTTAAIIKAFPLQSIKENNITYDNENVVQLFA